mgnify:CR=1 FL=1
MTQDLSTARGVLQAFIAAWNAGDADALAALFVEDADFVNVVGFWWRSARQIRKAHEYGFRRIFANARLDVLDVKLRAVTPEVTILHCVVALEGQSAPDGTPAGPRVTVLSMVTIRQETGLRILSCHNTDRVEGADTHLRDTTGFRAVDYR